MDSSVERTADELGMEPATVERVILTYQKYAGEEFQEVLAELRGGLEVTYRLPEE